jgi:pimeloyl-ACP methyl ester carboxylesterase
MPMQSFPLEPTKKYWIMQFDTSPAEVPDQQIVAGLGGPPSEIPGWKPGTVLLSECVEATLRAAADQGRPYTDVVVLSHGWLADYDGAVLSYNAWIRVVQLAETAARAEGRIPPDYHPLVIALHWPSKPSTLFHPADGQRVSMLLPMFSFYKMKELAGQTGRLAVAPMLRRLQEATPATTRFHLMGHSFGAKLVSQTLADPRTVLPVRSMFLIEGAMSTWGFAARDPYRGAPGLAVAVHREGMVTGVAVSSTSKWDWALRYSFPTAEWLSDRVRGVGRVVRPRPSWRVRHDEPRFGALGIYGFSGIPQTRLELHRAEPATSPQRFGFVDGGWYHLDASAVVDRSPLGPGEPKNNRWFEGAHSAIMRPEVAHAYWEAVFPTLHPATTSPTTQETVQA